MWSHQRALAWTKARKMSASFLTRQIPWMRMTLPGAARPSRETFGAAKPETAKCGPIPRRCGRPRGSKQSALSAVARILHSAVEVRDGESSSHFEAGSASEKFVLFGPGTALTRDGSKLVEETGFFPHDQRRIAAANRLRGPDPVNRVRNVDEGKAASVQKRAEIQLMLLAARLVFFPAIQPIEGCAPPQRTAGLGQLPEDPLSEEIQVRIEDARLAAQVLASAGLRSEERRVGKGCR